ncbi:MAG: helix-turn-helix domain-containing protein [Candidatus Hodarchaeales archaeon]|jgi:hypothetical protein
MRDNRISSQKMKKSREQKELRSFRELLMLPGNKTEEEIMKIWLNLKNMQRELNLPSLTPIEQYYDFYQKLEGIRQGLKLFSANFPQLNHLYIEITTLRELLGLPEVTPISEIISMIQKESLENIPSLGVGYDTLLLKVLILNIMGGITDQNELNDLRKLVSRKKNHSEETVINTLYFLRKMQEELAIPSLYPIRQHYYLFLKLEEIREVLNLSSVDFTQLYQIYNEIITVTKFYKLPETTPISVIIELIRNEPLERLTSLGIKYDSLLIKVLLSHFISNKRKSVEAQDNKTINELDRVLFEILKSYGPLSRPELVELTGIPRSSIYDSLKRLMGKGFVVQYSEKRSYTGRPTTVFDALI